MNDVLIVAIKGVAGGALVVAFALLSEGLGPKRFAGLFSAAPAVAIAGLTVVVIGETTHKAHENALGMIAGGVGMSAYAAMAVPLLRRTRAAAAAALALLAWTLAAAIVAVPVLVARARASANPRSPTAWTSGRGSSFPRWRRSGGGTSSTASSPAG